MPGHYRWRALQPTIRMSRRFRRLWWFLIAVGLRLVLVDSMNDQNSWFLQYSSQLTQHEVPPFQHRNLNDNRFHFSQKDFEFNAKDTFHTLHVQGGKPNNIAASSDDLFERLRMKAEYFEAQAGHSDQREARKSQTEGSGRLRGLYENEILVNGELKQFSLDRSSVSTQSDYVVIGEVDYSSRPGNETDSDETNSTDVDEEVYAESNYTSDEDSSSIVTKSNGTDINNTDTVGIGSKDDNQQETGGNKNKESGGDNDPGEAKQTSPPVVYQPIRIRAVLSEEHGGGEHLDPEQRQILLEEVVQPALLAWSEALRIPVRDPSQNLTLDSRQWIDGTTCGPGIDSGLPTARVPMSHLKYGVPETDLVLYLNLAFVYGPSAAPSAEDGSPGESHQKPDESPLVSDSANLADAHLSEDGTSVPSVSPSFLPSTQNKNSLQSESKVNGGSKSKVNRFNNGSPKPPSAQMPTSVPTAVPHSPRKPRAICAGDYLASSVFCSTNEFDRPTAALLHICIGDDFFDPIRLPRNIMTIMHELGHSLGFNLQSLAHFRKPDGSPITPRGANGVIPKKLIECTGPQLQGGRPKALMQLPSPDILKFRTVRSVRVAEVVTPSVAQVVRNHFDCQELLGAELESGEALPLSTNAGEMTCIGNHWERRLFKMDLMNPLVEDLRFEPLISILTLAYFADSGWYQVDLSRAAFPAIWGRAAGCAFVEEPCIQPNGQVVSGSDELFCNSLTNVDSQGYVTTLDGCTPDLTRKATCTMSQYDGELPPEYQYFSTTYGSNVGGLDSYMDYCPVYNGLKNGLCSDPGNEAILKMSNTERVGSPNSRCLSSLSTPSGSRMAMCLRIACVVKDKSLRVQVEGRWHKCNREGDKIFAKNRMESIICPNPVRVCPTFYCPRDCLGTGRACNYTIGECVSKCTYLVGDTTIHRDPYTDGTCPEIGRDPDDPLSPGSGSGGGHSGSGNEHKANDSPFFIPANDGAPSPKNGSSLSEIYFPDVRTLEGEGDNQQAVFQEASNPDNWKYCFVGLLILLLIPLLVVHKKRKVSSSSDDAADSGGGGLTEAMSRGRRRNKEKMIATVLVDLRMNDQNLENFRDVLVQRGSETDHSMTDTDPGSFVPWEDHNSHSHTLERPAGNYDVGELPPSLMSGLSGFGNQSFIMGSSPPPSNDVEVPTTILEHPTLYHSRSATIRRRFFRRGNDQMTTRRRSSVRDPQIPSTRRTGIPARDTLRL